jgi:hypothetical protein
MKNIKNWSGEWRYIQEPYKSDIACLVARMSCSSLAEQVAPNGVQVTPTAGSLQYAMTSQFQSEIYVNAQQGQGGINDDVLKEWKKRFKIFSQKMIKKLFFRNQKSKAEHEPFFNSEFDFDFDFELEFKFKFK